MKKNSVPFNNERWGFEKSKKNELSYLQVALTLNNIIPQWSLKFLFWKCFRNRSIKKDVSKLRENYEQSKFNP